LPAGSSINHGDTQNSKLYSTQGRRNIHLTKTKKKPVVIKFI